MSESEGEGVSSGKDEAKPAKRPPITHPSTAPGTWVPRSAPPGRAGPGWRDGGRAARPAGSVAQPESVHAVSHP
jgi:hypothetical protein